MVKIKIRNLLAIMAAAIWLGCALPANAFITPNEASLIYKTLGCTVGENKKCVVTYSKGGIEAEFYYVDKILAREGVRKEIVGFCPSACALGFDRWGREVDNRGRPLFLKDLKVCVGPNAIIAFHQGYDAGKWFPHRYSELLQGILDANGGEPAFHHIFIVLTGTDAIAMKLVPPCDTNEKVVSR